MTSEEKKYNGGALHAYAQHIWYGAWKGNDNYVSQLMVFGKLTSLFMNFLWLSTHHRDGLSGSGYRLTVSGQFTVAEIVKVKMQRP